MRSLRQWVEEVILHIPRFNNILKVLPVCANGVLKNQNILNFSAAIGNIYAHVAPVKRGLNWAYFMFNNRFRKYFLYAQMSSFIFETIIEFSAAIRNVNAQLVLMNRGLTSTYITLIWMLLWDPLTYLFHWGTRVLVLCLISPSVDFEMKTWPSDTNVHIHWYKFENDEEERILSLKCTVLCYILEYIYIVQMAKRRTRPVFYFEICKIRPNILQCSTWPCICMLKANRTCASPCYLYNIGIFQNVTQNVHLQEKKEDIWLSPMTKAPTPTEKSKKQSNNTKTPPKIRLHNDCGLT